MKTKKRTLTDKQIEQHVAHQLHDLRIAQGLTQQEMANEIGVTFQQYQKYEKGKNRISTGKLFVIANAYNLPVNAFFPVEKLGDYSPVHPRMRRIMGLAVRISQKYYDELLELLITIDKLITPRSDK